MRLLTSRAPLVAVGVVAAACSGPKAPPPTFAATATADTVIVPVVNVSVATMQPDGKWVMLAPVEGRVVVADFTADTATPYPGITTAVVPHPLTLIGAGDTTLIGDWGMSRVTAWTPVGTMVGSWPAPTELASTLPRARDAAGQWYFEVAPDPGANGQGLLDSAAIVRSDAAMTRFDTLARLAPPELVQVQGISGPRWQRRTMGGEDAWGVRPDGTLWIARVFQNQLEWHRPGSTDVTRSPLLPDLVLTNSEMDREIWVRRFPEDQREAARALPVAPVKPPFQQVFPQPDGRFWLAKSDTALARLRHFQVVDSTGVLVNVTVPTYGSALGVGGGHIVMAEEFPGGIRLLRFAIPDSVTSRFATGRATAP